MGMNIIENLFGITGHYGHTAILSFIIGNPLPEKTVFILKMGPNNLRTVKIEYMQSSDGYMKKCYDRLTSLSFFVFFPELVFKIDNTKQMNM